ncbi:MAG: HDOD domain-containing protein [Polyangiaceae bacterium]
MAMIIACGLRDTAATQLAELAGRKGDASTFVAAGSADAALALATSPAIDGRPVALISAIGTYEGEKLLRRAGKESPGLTRFAVAAGVADPANAVQAHRTLGESQSAAEWMDVIGRTCELRARLAAPATRRLVESVASLPAVPRAYWALMDALSNDDSTAADIAAIVQTEPSMAIRVLQIANSAFFGAGRQVRTIEAAVRYLGTNLLRGLILMIHVCGCCESNGPTNRNLSLEQFQDFSLRVARLARAMPAGRKIADEAYTAGLMLDIGRLALSLSAAEQFDEIHSRMAQGAPHLHVVEREVLGVSHAEVGASLLAGWGLPWPLVEAIAFHHSPSALGSTRDCEILAVVHAADALLGIAHGESEDQLDVDFLTRAGWGGELDRCRALAQKEAATA